MEQENDIKLLVKELWSILVEDGGEAIREMLAMKKREDRPLEALKYIDDIIFNFLNNLYKDNYLKDSSIFLLSDHGVGMPSFYYFYLIRQLLLISFLYLIYQFF